MPCKLSRAREEFLWWWWWVVGGGGCKVIFISNPTTVKIVSRLG